MESLLLNNFKAFNIETKINFENKNLILYGENGAGKSSLYQALKLIFFKERILSKFNHLVGEDLINEKKSFLKESYTHRGLNADYQIKINNIDVDDFDISSYQLIMFSLEEKKNKSKIKLLEILQPLFITNSAVISFAYIESLKEQLQTAVNESLSSFMEDLEIVIENEQEEFIVRVIDNERNINIVNDLLLYFNEAKINIIEILIVLNYGLICKDNTKTKILVLDDFVTSLDSSNRIFIAKFIFENFSDYKKIILTHNLSFFNLMLYLINNIYISNEWKYGNLYEIDKRHYIFHKSDMPVKDLEQKYKQIGTDPSNQDLEDLGNMVRKKFERILYEFSKLLSLGSIEDCSVILDRLSNGKDIYINGKKNSYDLIDEIIAVVNHDYQNNLRQRIIEKVSQYKSENLGIMRGVAKELKIYQKVSMHPLSHGATSTAVPSIKELKKSIELIILIENQIKGFINSNTSST